VVAAQGAPAIELEDPDHLVLNAALAAPQLSGDIPPAELSCRAVALQPQDPARAAKPPSAAPYASRFDVATQIPALYNPILAVEPGDRTSA
jgi:hypothetical protein